MKSIVLLETSSKKNFKTRSAVVCVFLDILKIVFNNSFLIIP